MLILFIRHGETYHNVKEGIDQSLTSRGKKQIAMVAKRLKTYTPEAIYASPLERALQTAQEIHQYHPGLKLQILPGLTEIPRALVGVHTPWVFEGKAIIPSRSMISAYKKSADAMFEKMLSWKHETVIVVCHGTLISYFLTKFLKIPANRGQYFRIDNTSVTAVQYKPHKTRIILLNGRKHLPSRLTIDPHLHIP